VKGEFGGAAKISPFNAARYCNGKSSPVGSLGQGMASLLQTILPNKNSTPGTAIGTEREITVAVARAIWSGVTAPLVGCSRPG